LLNSTESTAQTGHQSHSALAITAAPTCAGRVHRCWSSSRGRQPCSRCFDHKRVSGGSADHLMRQRIWTHTVSSSCHATAAGLGGGYSSTSIHPLDRPASSARDRDGPAASPLAATACTGVPDGLKPTVAEVVWKQLRDVRPIGRAGLGRSVGQGGEFSYGAVRSLGAAT